MTAPAAVASALRGRVAVPDERGRRHRRRRALFAIRMLPVMALYLVFLVLPYLDLVRISFHRHGLLQPVAPGLTLGNYTKLFTDPFYARLTVFTIVLSAGVTLVTLVLGYPVAWRIVRARAGTKSLLIAMVLSPLFVNLVVRTYAWQVLLGETGVVNTWLQALGLIAHPLPLSRNVFGVAVGLVQITLPFMVLSLVSIMEMVPPGLIEAAEGLGAGWRRIFTEILWPLTLPGVTGGSVLVFCYCTSAFVTPQVLGGGQVATISTLIFEQFSFALNYPFGAVLVMLLLVVNFLVIGLQERLARDHGYLELHPASRQADS